MILFRPALKSVLAAGLIAVAATAGAQAAPAKKELVQRLMTLQQPGVEALARTIAERPAQQLWQAALQAIQTKVPADKREAAAKQVQADLTKFVNEATPIIRDRAVKLMPTTIGPVLEQEMTEDELKQVIAWLESPVSKKFSDLQPDMTNALIKALLPDAAPVSDPKLKQLEQQVAKTLGIPLQPAPGASAAAPAGSGKAPAKK